LINVRKIAKKSDLVTSCYRWTWSSFRAALYRLSPALLAKYRYRLMTGKRLNLKVPQSFDEKLLWLMLYWRHPLKIECGDKYNIRNYVKKHGLEHILPKLLGVYENSSEIDFNTLPRRFVLKCTHGCGFNIVCKDKGTLDVQETCGKLDAWMKVDLSKICGEIHYAKMKPRIICEEYLDDLAGDLPIDYKVYCFDGRAHCTMVCTERALKGRTNFDFYDLEWKNKLPYNRTSMLVSRGIPRPEAYEEIIEAAEKLSKPFPFVRMDFYSIKGKAVLGEMTFTPNGCIDTDYTDIGQQKLGELLKLPGPLM